MPVPYSTSGPLIRTRYQNPNTGERTAEIRANVYVEGDLDVVGEITQNGAPLETGEGGLEALTEDESAVITSKTFRPSGALIPLGVSSFPFSALYIGSSSSARTQIISGATSPRTLTLPNTSGTVAIANAAVTQGVIPVGGSIAGVFVASRITDNGVNLIIEGLPTGDPAVAGALWNDSGTLKISAG
jgi:hypothetical protein